MTCLGFEPGTFRSLSGVLVRLATCRGLVSKNIAMSIHQGWAVNNLLLCFFYFVYSNHKKFLKFRTSVALLSHQLVVQQQGAHFDVFGGNFSPILHDRYMSGLQENAVVKNLLQKSKQRRKLKFPKAVNIVDGVTK